MYRFNVAIVNADATHYTPRFWISFYLVLRVKIKNIIPGRNLVKHMDYRSINGFIYYKSDEQTNQGTRATGKQKNHLYKIEVPKFGKRKSEATKDDTSQKKSCTASSTVATTRDGGGGGAGGGGRGGGGGGGGSGQTCGGGGGREAFLRRIEKQMKEKVNSNMTNDP